MTAVQEAAIAVLYWLLTHLLCCRDANRVNEEWFSDMDAVRAAVGMVDEAPEPSGSSDKVGCCSCCMISSCR